MSHLFCVIMCYIIFLLSASLRSVQSGHPKKCYQHIKDAMKDDQKYYLLLDEVQFMSRFEEVLNSLLRISNIDVYVTGSNSKFLSSDIVTEFRGRGDEIRIYPLSFAEFYAAFDGDYDDAWEAFLISKADRYDIKGRKYVGANLKYYFTDVGLRNARLNFRQQEPTHIMENIVYNELLIRGYNVDVGIVEAYAKNDEGKTIRKQFEVLEILLGYCQRKEIIDSLLDFASYLFYYINIEVTYELLTLE